MSKKPNQPGDQSEKIVFLNKKIEDLTTSKAQALDEIASLKTKISDLEIQLKNQRELHRREMVRRDNDIMITNEEMKTKVNELTLKNEQLSAQVLELNASIEGYKIIEEESSRMKYRIEALMEALENETSGHALEVHKLKYSEFQHRLELEKAFRDSLTQAEDELKKKNFDDLDEYQKSFFRQNTQLQKEIKIQKEGIQDILARYKIYDEQIRKLNLDNSILKEENKQLHEYFAQLKQKMLRSKEKMIKIKAENAELTKRSQELRSYRMQIDELSQQNTDLQNKVMFLDKQVEKWKKRSLSLTRSGVVKQRIGTFNKPSTTSYTSDLQQYNSSEETPFVWQKDYSENRPSSMINKSRYPSFPKLNTNRNPNSNIPT